MSLDNSKTQKNEKLPSQKPPRLPSRVIERASATQIGARGELADDVPSHANRPHSGFCQIDSARTGGKRTMRRYADLGDSTCHGESVEGYSEHAAHPPESSRDPSRGGAYRHGLWAPLKTEAHQMPVRASTRGTTTCNYVVPPRSSSTFDYP